MTIKEFQNQIDQQIAQHNKEAYEADSKYGEGLHEGQVNALLWIKYMLTFVEIKDNE